MVLLQHPTGRKRAYLQKSGYFSQENLISFQTNRRLSTDIFQKTGDTARGRWQEIAVRMQNPGRSKANSVLVSRRNGCEEFFTPQGIKCSFLCGGYEGNEG